MKQGTVRPVWRILLCSKWAPNDGITSDRAFPCGDPCFAVKGQLRDAVKTCGNQPTHIRLIHRRNLSDRASLQYFYNDM